MDHTLSTAQMGDQDPPFLSGNPTGYHRGSDQSGVSDGFLSGQTHPTPGPVPTLSYHLVSKDYTGSLLLNLVFEYLLTCPSL
jgi:hypothetical protein